MQHDLAKMLRASVGDSRTRRGHAAGKKIGRRGVAAVIRKRYSPSQVMWIISGAFWSWRRLSANGSPAMDVHRSYRRHCWRRYGIAGRFVACVGFVAGIPIALALIFRYTRIRGDAVLRETGKGPIRQLREQLGLWLGQGVLPMSYYMFELYRGDRRATALEYLFRYETKRGVYAILRDAFSARETTDALRDKAEFALRCRRYGVAAIPALFSIRRGTVKRLDGSAAGLPRCDLFLKPLSGSGGRGAAVWLHVGNGTYWNQDASALTESELVDHLRALAEHEPYVGRPYVRNHPLIADLSPGALSSVRIITCLDENRRAETTHAVLRMARTTSSLVDNFHAGGIAARVDLETGILGEATDIGLNSGTQWWSAHPTTGAQILGRRIPMWPDLLDLVRRAHAVFPDQVIVGWDVAILEDGPQLVEGNKSPDLDIVQRTGQTPVGPSRLGKLLAHHLRRAERNETPPHLELETPIRGERLVAGGRGLQ